MLIIWLQGIWLPLHGYSFESTPLWAGIYMLPLTVGFLAAGPVSGHLSDRFGARPFAVGGALLVAAAFVALMLLPVDFPYPAFALLVLLSGVGSGLFSAPNSATSSGRLVATPSPNIMTRGSRRISSAIASATACWTMSWLMEVEVVVMAGFPRS